MMKLKIQQRTIADGEQRLRATDGERVQTAAGAAGKNDCSEFSNTPGTLRRRLHFQTIIKGRYDSTGGRMFLKVCRLLGASAAALSSGRWEAGQAPRKGRARRREGERSELFLGSIFDGEKGHTRDASSHESHHHIIRGFGRRR